MQKTVFFLSIFFSADVCTQQSLPELYKNCVEQHVMPEWIHRLDEYAEYEELCELVQDFIEANSKHPFNTHMLYKKLCNIAERTKELSNILGVCKHTNKRALSRIKRFRNNRFIWGSFWAIVSISLGKDLIDSIAAILRNAGKPWACKHSPESSAFGLFVWTVLACWTGNKTCKHFLNGRAAHRLMQHNFKIQKELELLPAE